MGPEPSISAAMWSATARAALSANAPARGTGASAQSPSAYTFGKGVARFRGSTAIQPSVPPRVSPEASTTAGTRCTGIPMNNSYGISPVFSWARCVRIQPTYPPAGRVADGAFRECLHNCRRGLRRNRDRRLHRADHIDLGGVSHSATEQIVMQQQGALVRRRRALERNPEDRDEHPAARKRLQDVTQPLGAGHGVVLVTVRL